MFLSVLFRPYKRWPYTSVPCLNLWKRVQFWSMLPENCQRIVPQLTCVSSAVRQGITRRINIAKRALMLLWTLTSLETNARITRNLPFNFRSSHTIPLNKKDPLNCIAHPGCYESWRFCFFAVIRPQQTTLSTANCPPLYQWRKLTRLIIHAICLLIVLWGPYHHDSIVKSRGSYIKSCGQAHHFMFWYAANNVVIHICIPSATYLTDLSGGIRWQANKAVCN